MKAPPRREPDIGVPAPDGWTATEAATPLPETRPDWWQGFADARLDALIERALLQNRDLQATAARLEQAAAQARIAGADLEPSVAAGLNGGRSRQVFIGFPIPGTTGVPSATFSSFGLDVSVSWEVDLWGRIRAGTRAALADLQSVGFDYHAARLSIAAQTAKAWFAVTEATQQLALARDSAGSFRESAELVRSRYEAGTRPPIDLRLALTRQAEAEALEQLRRQQLDATVRRLEVLVGSYPAGELRAAVELPDTPAPIAAGLPSELVARRPDLVAAERRLAASDQRWLVARRSLYPRLSLTGSGGTASDQLEDLLDGDFRVWSLLGNLVQPLFQGGRLRAGVDLAAAVGDEALARYASALLAAYAEVETALAAEETLARREASLREAAHHSRAAERLSLDRYRTGLDDYITVLQAQASALTAESQWLAVRRARLENRVDLHAALGGGFEYDPEAFRLRAAAGEPVEGAR
jgi:NodT family efflux transporter outer membrane factor (OMF) lipoprotein